MGRILTIGHGGRTIESMVAILKREGVDFLIDVRSRPYSKFQPEFNQQVLKLVVEKNGIRYVFMGDLLGGLPSDPSVYVDGHVDYELCRQRQWFKDGIARLEISQSGGHAIALMCSEKKPESCHRSKLIGVELNARKLFPEHIDEKDQIIDQNAVIGRLTGGQSFLFEGMLNQSVKRHKPEDSDNAS